LLNESIDFIKMQNMYEFEIIVSINATTDNTIMEISKFKKKYTTSNIKTIQTETPGKPNAINSCIKIAKGNIVIIMDADVKVAKNAIENILKYIPYSDDGYVISSVSDTKKNFYLNPIKAKLSIKIKEYGMRDGLSVDGALYMVNKKYFPKIPNEVINDDLYIAIYFGVEKIIRAKDVIVYQEPVGNFTEYFFRRRRIEKGDIQIKDIFGEQYDKFKTTGRDKRSKLDRKKDLGLLLNLYNIFLFPIDLTMKYLNKVAKREISNDSFSEHGWNTQKSSKFTQ
ncbi:MAG: glycosyltransferase, partial [Campylobacterales bacterium]